jgi:hypothetical protein
MREVIDESRGVNLIGLWKFFSSAYRLVAGAQRMLMVNARRETITSDHQFGCARSL